ncbi:MAG: ATP-binding protein, partial [Anaerolineales bacterium]
MIFKVFLIFPETSEAVRLAEWILEKPGYQVEILQGSAEFYQRPQIEFPCAIIMDERVSPEGADGIIQSNPMIPVLYYSRQDGFQAAYHALERGFRGILPASADRSLLYEKLDQAGEFQRNLQKWVIGETRRNTRTLQKRVDDLERLRHISRHISTSLQLDKVLKEVVIAAVELSAAEEAQLLLLDPSSGELILRSSYTRDQGQTRLLRLPVHDTLIGEVFTKKQPLALDGEDLKKIQTAFLVRALIFVPLLIGEEAVGVLGVLNRRQSRTFTEYERTLLEALADFAAIAIQNANLYHSNDMEREKLKTILNQIQDAVLVIDREKRLLFVNHKAMEAFRWTEKPRIGLPLEQVIMNQEMALLLQEVDSKKEKWHEVHLDSEEIWNCQITPMEGVGYVITLHEITHFKELDRQKTEFVNAVSHDLRSPLTAILGYTELIKRVGEINERQYEYLRRIQSSVQGITALINDLLDLGRIEAGMDTHKELLEIDSLITRSIETVAGLAIEKGTNIQIDIQKPLPPVFGNAIRIQQMVTNLVGNALKYTQPGGKIGVRAWQEQGQVVLQVWDNGVGIPLAEQPHIFEKFFRGSNLPDGEGGSGLGLTIVKSIVDD